jgi:hypothetical protein
MPPSPRSAASEPAVLMVKRVAHCQCSVVPRLLTFDIGSKTSKACVVASTTWHCYVHKHKDLASGAHASAKRRGAGLVLHWQLLAMGQHMLLCCAVLCCADYGVVCCWGLTAKQEQDILSSLAKKAQQQPLPPREVSGLLECCWWFFTSMPFVG